jgi:hypothetical protein
LHRGGWLRPNIVQMSNVPDRRIIEEFEHYTYFAETPE